MANKQKVFNYLNALRDSGIVNMFGAVPYVRKVFNVSQAEGIGLLVEWMESYKEEK